MSFLEKGKARRFQQDKDKSWTMNKEWMDLHLRNIWRDRSYQKEQQDRGQMKSLSVVKNVYCFSRGLQLPTASDSSSRGSKNLWFPWALVLVCTYTYGHIIKNSKDKSFKRIETLVNCKNGAIILPLNNLTLIMTKQKHVHK